MGKELTPEEIAAKEAAAELAAKEQALQEKIETTVKVAVDAAIEVAVAKLQDSFKKDLEALANALQVAPSSFASEEPEAKEPYKPIVVKEVKYEKTDKGQKRSGKGDFTITAPSVMIDHVLYTAEELSKDAAMLTQLASAGSSFLKPHFSAK